MLNALQLGFKRLRDTGQSLHCTLAGESLEYSRSTDHTLAQLL